jgi:hypothetical protein
MAPREREHVHVMLVAPRVYGRPVVDGAAVERHVAREQRERAAPSCGDVPGCHDRGYAGEVMQLAAPKEGGRVGGAA